MGFSPEHLTIETNGIKLHVAAAGPQDGPLVILLHGFPEFWYGWRRFIEPLAERGYRVLAPDQRGYGTSDKPAGVRAYAVEELGADILGLIKSQGRSKAHLVAHDWGGIVAWWLACEHKDWILSTVMINIPHPKVLDRFLKRCHAQRKRSWYVFAFQLPVIPEAFLRRKDYAFLRTSLEKTSRKGAFTSEELTHYREAWRQPGALTGMINWYRAAFRARPKWPADLRVQVPLLLIWGTKDRFLGEEMAQPSVDLCENARLELIPGATHWVVHEQPERVLGLVMRHLEAQD